MTLSPWRVVPKAPSSLIRTRATPLLPLCTPSTTALGMSCTYALAGIIPLVLKFDEKDDIARTSNIPLAQLEAEYSEWVKKYPKGMTVDGKCRDTYFLDLIAANEVWGIWKKDRGVVEQIFAYLDHLPARAIDVDGNGIIDAKEWFTFRSMTSKHGSYEVQTPVTRRNAPVSFSAFGIRITTALW